MGVTMSEFEEFVQLANNRMKEHDANNSLSIKKEQY